MAHAQNAPAHCVGYVVLPAAPKSIPTESVVRIVGKVGMHALCWHIAASSCSRLSAPRCAVQVQARPADMVNTGMLTGAVEVAASHVEVLNTAEELPVPIELHGHKRTEAGENTRLRHRHVDLRRSELQRNLRVRARLAQAGTHTHRQCSR